MSIKTKLVGGIATGALLLGAFAPSAFASGTSVTVSGNAQGSNNHVKVVNKSKSNLTQANLVGVVNLVGTFQNTGGNKANNNNGGSNTVKSGNATSSVTNTTTVGGNSATVAPCGCLPGDVTVDVSGNAQNSNNSVNVVNKSNSTVTQFNGTLVVNGVLTVQNTGGNTANNNNGGSSDVTSGDADSTVMNSTTVGGNVLNP